MGGTDDQPTRSPRVGGGPFVAVLLGTAALRLLAVAGLELHRYVDSIEYDVLDFSGRHRRPWATPLLYAFIKDHDDRLIVVTQALLGALAWTGLAFAIASHVRDRRVRIGAVATVIALSLTTTVTNWDTAKLSESLAITLTVAVIAAWLHLVRSPSSPRAAVVLLVTTPWLFVRQSLLPTAWIVTVVAILLAVLVLRRRGRVDRTVRIHLALAVALVLVCGLATLSYGRNQEIAHTNLTAMISNRIAHDPDHLDWFVDHGMVLPPGDATDFGSLEADLGFQRWIRDEGGRTYVRFLLEHPGFALTGPIPDLFEQRPNFLNVPPYVDHPLVGSEAMLSPRDAYGTARPLLPDPVESLLLDPGRTGTVTTLTLVLLGWAVVEFVGRARRRPRTGSGAPPVLAWTTMTLGVLTVVGYWAVWHGATTELARLGLVPALTLRIALITGFAALADHRLRAAYPRP